MNSISKIPAFLSLIVLPSCLTASRDSVVVHNEAPVVSSYTVSPDIPEKVQFCGNDIDTRRYNMHEGIDRELTLMTYLHSSTMLLFKRANRWFPVIEPVLRENDIPDDFKYLAVIESNLDPSAVSPARAVGIWQLLETTARSYGLTVTAAIDERRHIRKATQAACKYLREAYSKFGDWMTVAVAYNSGMGRMAEQIEKQQTKNVYNLAFTEETMRYPYRLLACKLVFENPSRYGFLLKPENLYMPITCTETPVHEDITNLAKFALDRGITYLDLKMFNPWLRDSKLMLNGKTYTLLIPDREQLYYNKTNSYVHNKNWVVSK
jgi:hypothetical protein